MKPGICGPVWFVPPSGSDRASPSGSVPALQSGRKREAAAAGTPPVVPSAADLFTPASDLFKLRRHPSQSGVMGRLPRRKMSRTVLGAQAGPPATSYLLVQGRLRILGIQELWPRKLWRSTGRGA